MINPMKVDRAEIKRTPMVVKISPIPSVIATVALLREIR